jgi:small subunit ribosomal protein S17
MADETEETTDDVTGSDAAPASAEAPSDDVVAEESAVAATPEPAAAAAPAAPAAATAPAKAATPPVEDGERPNRRKVREGVVVSDAMQATVVVAVVERVRHPRYGKTVQRTKKLYVHDAEDTAKVGDRVRVQETRPLSKLKRWRLTEVVERAR